MADFVMPRLGADMESGTLVEWRKHPGDAVHRGDVVADVETDKGVIAVEAFTSGTLEEVLIQPGERVPVGAVLAKIRDGTAESPTVTPGGERSVVAPGRSAMQPPVTAPQPALSQLAPAELHSSLVGSKPLPIRRVAISPSARRMARQLGIDPSTVRGTGRSGVIHRIDIERAAAERLETPAETALQAEQAAKSERAAKSEWAARSEQAGRMRQAIAAAMARSKREIPHYYLSTTIDVHRAVEWLQAENERRGVSERMFAGALFLKATALALREIPELNGTWEEGRAQPRSEIHVGVAISLRGGGLIAPAIHDTDQLSLGELMGKLRDLAERARSGGLRSSELADGTITVTSLGDRGVETVFGVIYPPQVAIVGFGKIVERPWAEGGGIFSRPVVTATLAADHRASDGHRGGLFLSALDRLLQEPEKL